MEAFELVTDQKKTRLPLLDTLSGWTDEVEHRLNEFVILNRASVIHQSRLQGPRRFTLKILLRDPGASEAYKIIEATLGADPFAQMIHPRYGHVPVVFKGLRASEEPAEALNGMLAELALSETGLRQAAAENATKAVREAATAAATARARSAPIAALAQLGVALDEEVTRFVDLVDQVSGMYLLATALSRVSTAAEALAAASGVQVVRYRITSAARLAYGRCLAAYQLLGAQQPPVVERVVPARMSLARFCQSLYGGGAQAIEAEIMRLNRIRDPHGMPAGLRLLLPDPLVVKL